MLAERDDLQPPVLWAALGVTIARGEEHTELWDHVGVEGPLARWSSLPYEVAYVGDRVDTDVLPAAAAGLVAVHVRRGPWGRVQRTPAAAAIGVADLASLPEALASFL